MNTKREHLVQVILRNNRYVASEMAGIITVKRDTTVLGKAKWDDDTEQMVLSTALLPDEVFEALEQKLKVAFATNWGEN